MSKITDDFTIGIEEEYLLVDPATGELAEDPPKQILRDCGKALDKSVGVVVPEFLRAQVEVGTAVCRSIGEARAKLAELRRCVAAAAGEYGLAPVAASTHPSAVWTAQLHTDKKRYNLLAEDMQAVARRLVICGMHVHVRIRDDDLRIDLLNQVTCFLPPPPALPARWPGRSARQSWLSLSASLRSRRSNGTLSCSPVARSFSLAAPAASSSSPRMTAQRAPRFEALPSCFLIERSV